MAADPVTVGDIPAPLTYGLITGKFISVMADSADAGDTPDMKTLNGTVTIAPNMPVVRVTAADGTSYIAATPNVAAIVVDGNLLGPDGTPLRMLASDSPGINPAGLLYTATFSLKGITAQPPTMTFALPSTGIDLATAATLANAPGTIVVSTQVVRMTQDQYNRTTPNNSTLYVITN